jgi:hypothetical protein
VRKVSVSGFYGKGEVGMPMVMRQSSQAGRGDGRHYLRQSTVQVLVDTGRP